MQELGINREGSERRQSDSAGMFVSSLQLPSFRRTSQAASEGVWDSTLCPLKSVFEEEQSSRRTPWPASPQVLSAVALTLLRALCSESFGADALTWHF